MIFDGQVVQSRLGALLVALLSQAFVWLFVRKVELVNLGQLFYESPCLKLSFHMEFRLMSGRLVSSWGAEYFGLPPHALDVRAQLV